MNRKDFIWGIGIEHELHLFHIPNGKDTIKDIIVFDAERGINRILDSYKKKKINLKKSDYEFLKSIPFELSGRTCNGKKVINKIPIKMPELITSYPFCKIDKMRIKEAIEDISEFKEKLILLLKKDETTKNLIKEYGAIEEYPYGMTRYAKYGTIKNNKYIFKNDGKTDKPKLYSDYTGSYHITLTLPHTDKTTNEEFIKIHKNFCNQFQWIEPLLLLGFFSGDESAPGSTKNKIRGSYRIMNLGWGNMAGSDVRLFDEGIGRYAKTKLYWREKFDFDGLDNLKPCIKPSPYAKKEGGITSYGTDLRTFGDNSKGMRVSGYPMNKPNGIEIRIFDNFSSKKIISLMTFLFLLIENSFNTDANSYVYENKVWINEIQNIMKYGYTAKINKKYIELIENKLNITIKYQENENLYNCLLESLYNKNKNGFYFKLLRMYDFKKTNNKILGGIKKYYMNINQKSWELAFLLKLNRNENILVKFNQFLKIIEYLEKINYEKIKNLITISLGDNWINDVDNILIFLKYLKFINYKNINFKKNMIKINFEYFKQFNNKIINLLIMDQHLGPEREENISSIIDYYFFKEIYKNNNENK